MSTAAVFDSVSLCSPAKNSPRPAAAQSRAIVRLLVGHTSRPLPSVNAKGHTHQWTVFVRATGPEKFTDRAFVRQVTFLLNCSFPNPTRVIRMPPFELSETGFGSFSLPIVIYIKEQGKSFRISYDLTLPQSKPFENRLELSYELANPSAEFISLVGRYCQPSDRSRFMGRFSYIVVAPRKKREENEATKKNKTSFDKGNVIRSRDGRETKKSASKMERDKERSKDRRETAKSPKEEGKRSAEEKDKNYRKRTLETNGKRAEGEKEAKASRKRTEEKESNGKKTEEKKEGNWKRVKEEIAKKSEVKKGKESNDKTEEEKESKENNKKEPAVPKESNAKVSSAEAATITDLSGQIWPSSVSLDQTPSVFPVIAETEDDKEMEKNIRIDQLERRIERLERALEDAYKSVFK